MAKQALKTFSKKYILLWLVAVVIIASCSSTDEQAGIAEATPPETDFIQLKADTAAVESTYPGTIEGSVNVDIKAQVSGYLEAVYIKEGDYVQKGQSLFKIKSDVYNEQVNSSNAALKAAQAEQANAKLQYEKLKPLVEGKVISSVQLKAAQASYEAATAQVAQAKSALGSSKINAGFALIKAPVSGYMGRIPNRLGNLVTPTDAVPLTTLSEINNVFVYFSMSEGDFIRYQKMKGAQNPSGERITLTMADGSVYNQAGRLEMGSGNIERTTGSITMKAIFPNPDKLLRLGGAGRVVIHTALANVVSLPMTAVKDIQDKYFVFKLADSNKVTMVPIEFSGTSGNSYLVKSGVQAGEKIAIDRIDMLNDGMPVKPKLLPSASTASK